MSLFDIYKAKKLNNGINIDDVLGDKYGIVDLGTISWGYSGGIFTNSNDVPFSKAATGWSGLTDFICSRYGYASWSLVDSPESYDKLMCLRYVNGTQFTRIADSSFSNADEFKESLKGVYLIFELDKSTT